MSWCTCCQEAKPISDFSPKTRHPGGSYATVLSRCKCCLAALKRERRRADPEWAKATDQRDWQRIKNDPEKLARRRLLTKENGTVHRVRSKTQSQLVSDHEADLQAAREGYNPNR